MLRRAMMASNSGGGGDPHWADVTSLLHMEGANGGTTFTDQRSVSWARSASAQTNTGQAKFGASSMLVAGGGIAGPNALSSSGFGAGSFTIEGWFYATNTTTRGLFDAALASSANSIAAGWDQASATWQVYFAGSVYSSSATSITLNTWTHFALVRNGSSCVLYINGTAVVSFSSSANLAFANMNYGRYYNTTFPWVGYIDECRITKGVARYTGAFSPPVSQFPDS